MGPKSLLYLLALCLYFNATCQDITIKELVWTNAVTARTASNRYQDSIPMGQVGVWINAQCTHTAFETIKSEGFLPIRYKWYKRAGPGWTAKGVDKPDDNVHVELASIPDSLRVNDTLDFYWQSWCIRKKSKMSKGTWKIVIATVNNLPLAEAEIQVTANDD